YFPSTMATGPLPECYTVMDIATTLTAVAMGKLDVVSSCYSCLEEVPLPFPFAMYGRVYSTVFVSSSGLLSFINQTISTVPSATTLPRETIAVAWNNWDLSRAYSSQQGVFVVVRGEAPYRTVTFSWLLMALHSSPV